MATAMKTPVLGALSARHNILLLCDQTSPASFTDVLTPNMLKQCMKIGEGAFGDVYKTKREQTSVVLKLIPIAGDFCVNNPQQKMFEEILSEIIISKELSDLRHNTKHSTENFVEVKHVSLVEDRYHPALLHQWDVYAAKEGTLNGRPDMFPDTQLFVVFELEACGDTLHSSEFNSPAEAYSVMAQMTLALAVAEKALQFEHRDLHMGNVLIKRLPHTDSTAQYRIEGVPMSINTEGLHVSIIDFSLSRISKDGCSMFCDLSTNPALFEGKGDIIFDTYRGMMYETGNIWKEYRPYTNVLWLHYLVDKLLRYVTYPDSSIKEHYRIIRHFRTLDSVALASDSAYDLITECSFFNNILAGVSNCEIPLPTESSTSLECTENLKEGQLPTEFSPSERKVFTNEHHAVLRQLEDMPVHENTNVIPAVSSPAEEARTINPYWNTYDHSLQANTKYETIELRKSACKKLNFDEVENEHVSGGLLINIVDDEAVLAHPEPVNNELMRKTLNFDEVENEHVLDDLLTYIADEPILANPEPVNNELMRKRLNCSEVENGHVLDDLLTYIADEPILAHPEPVNNELMRQTLNFGEVENEHVLDDLLTYIADEPILANPEPVYNELMRKRLNFGEVENEDVGDDLLINIVDDEPILANPELVNNEHIAIESSIATIHEVGMMNKSPFYQTTENVPMDDILMSYLSYLSSVDINDLLTKVLMNAESSTTGGDKAQMINESPFSKTMGNVPTDEETSSVNLHVVRNESVCLEPSMVTDDAPRVYLEPVKNELVGASSSINIDDDTVEYEPTEDEPSILQPELVETDPVGDKIMCSTSKHCKKFRMTFNRKRKRSVNADSDSESDDFIDLTDEEMNQIPPETSKVKHCDTVSPKPDKRCRKDFQAINHGFHIHQA